MCVCEVVLHEAAWLRVVWVVMVVDGGGFVDGFDFGFYVCSNYCYIICASYANLVC